VGRLKAAPTYEGVSARAATIETGRHRQLLAPSIGFHAQRESNGQLRLLGLRFDRCGESSWTVRRC